MSAAVAALRRVSAQIQSKTWSEAKERPSAGLPSKSVGPTHSGSESCFVFLQRGRTGLASYLPGARDAAQHLHGLRLLPSRRATLRDFPGRLHFKLAQRGGFLAFTHFFVRPWRCGDAHLPAV